MHYLIFIKCNTINEDYQIKNTQHSKFLNHLRDANQRVYKLYVQEKKRKGKKEKRKRRGKERKERKKKLTSQCITPMGIKCMAPLRY